MAWRDLYQMNFIDIKRDIYSHINFFVFTWLHNICQRFLFPIFTLFESVTPRSQHLNDDKNDVIRKNLDPFHNSWQRLQSPMLGQFKFCSVMQSLAGSRNDLEYSLNPLC